VTVRLLEEVVSWVMGISLIFPSSSNSKCFWCLTRELVDFSCDILALDGVDLELGDVENPFEGERLYWCEPV